MFGEGRLADSSVANLLYFKVMLQGARPASR